MATIRFCSECNNMLYPKENRQEKSLLFACRNCDHIEENQGQHCVYQRNVSAQTAFESNSVVLDLSSDPTYPRSLKHPCPSCGHHESVFFQSRSKGKDASMKLFFACTNPNCGHRWVD